MTRQTKPAKKAPGRPRKAAADKLEQFSIRLPPKLKFGLEMLARHQHRSLSQAVEWAVQVGLNSVHVDKDGTSLGAVLDRAWKSGSEAERTLAIYRYAPGLLSFEEAACCELLEHSADLTELWRHVESGPHSAAELRAMGAELDRIYWESVLPHWDQVHQWAIEESNAGRSVTGLHVAHRLGFLDKPERKRLPLWDIYLAEAGASEAGTLS